MNMNNRSLSCRPLPVNTILELEDLEGQIVCVHGVIFHGEGCEPGEFLILPKDGPFDGVGPIPLPNPVNRRECILIEEGDLDQKLGGSSVAGNYRYKYDAILIGCIRRIEDSVHPVRITDLLMVVMQDIEEYGVGIPNHDFRVILFSKSFPSPPWRGYEGTQFPYPLIQIQG
jgi:hypothetical protein